MQEKATLGTVAFCLLCDESQKLLVLGHVGHRLSRSPCPCTTPGLLERWCLAELGILGAPLLTLGVNSITGGALKPKTTPSPGPPAMHRDPCCLKSMPLLDRQKAEALGSEPGRAGLPSLPPAVMSCPPSASPQGCLGQSDFEDEGGLEGRMQRCRELAGFTQS